MSEMPVAEEMNRIACGFPSCLQRSASSIAPFTAWFASGAGRTLGSPKGRRRRNLLLLIGAGPRAGRAPCSARRAAPCRGSAGRRRGIRAGEGPSRACASSPAASDAGVAEVVAYLPRVRLGQAAGSIATMRRFLPPRSCARGTGTPGRRIGAAAGAADQHVRVRLPPFSNCAIASWPTRSDA